MDRLLFSSFQRPIPRWVFLTGSTALVTMVSVAVYLNAIGALPAPIQPVLYLGVLVQFYLVRCRELDIQPKSGWRFWYLIVLSGIVYMAISSIYIGSWEGSEDIRRLKLGQVALGYYFLYYLLALPVILSCSFRRSREGSVNSSPQNVA